MLKLSNQEERVLKGIKDLFVLNGKIPGIGKLMSHLNLNSTRGTVKIIDGLIEKEFLRKSKTGRLSLTDMKIQFSDLEDYTDTIKIPVLGEVACGIPVLAEENIETYISVSTSIAKPDSKHFFLRAKGTSMDNDDNYKPINDGDFLLIRVQNFANEGDRIVALIDDEATVKAYYPKSDHVVLKPRTSEPQLHRPILVKGGFKIQGVVIDVIDNIDEFL